MPHCKPAPFLALFLTLATATSRTPLMAAPADSSTVRLSAALADAGLAVGASLRSVTLSGGTLTVDFAPQAAEGLTDSGLEAITDTVRRTYRENAGIEQYALTAGGNPLSSYLPPVPYVPPMAAEPPRAGEPNVGALSGKTIVLSPGHGWTYYGTNPYWHLQRSYYFGIVEDFVNQEIIQNVYNLLVSNGATVYTTREMDKTYPDCNTAFTFAGLNRPAPDKPWWQMAALYYTVRKGAPSSVYVNGRANDYDRDIAARPLYANYLNADIMVSLHNNGFDGTATGTETLYDNANGQTVTDAVNQYGSQYLAQKIQNKIISELRANYNSSWANRGAQGFAGSYGENRIATRPAVLVEAAFMDRESPDSKGLRDESFKLLLAKAIYEGICDYFHVTPTFNTTIAGPAGEWTGQAWNKTTAFKVGAPVNAPLSSAGGWVYAATDAGSIHGASVTPASGLAPALRWRYPASGGIGAGIRARPTVYGDSVFAIAVNGTMVALDRLTGERRWSVVVPSSGNLTASPAATPDGLLVVGSDNGYLYAHRQDTGERVGISPVAFGAVRAQAAIPDSGHVWVSSEDGRVRCLSGDLRTVLWETNTGSPARTAPYVLTANNAVYFTNEAKAVFALNASNGTPATGWTPGGARFGAAITTSVFADGESGLVAFGMANHTISAVYVDAPVMPVNFPLRPAGVKEFTSDPVLVNGTIVLGGTDGRLYALKPVNGASAPGADWRVFDTAREALPGPFNAAVTVTGAGPDDRVVAGSHNGWLYVLPLM